MVRAFDGQRERGVPVAEALQAIIPERERADDSAGVRVEDNRVVVGGSTLPRRAQR